ncbi:MULTISPECIES: DUF1819 family protein [unclassified Ectothiorhodospira]|uniref:DUF1819 family protein n=1 Tax=unclassified Ectothiorhodospira TaxID=2684909 RepID=UPI001EE7E57E|nr:MULTISPECIES: DUF1819 family protein [unclassified Ectothiorhodospira]MCG5516452.1 DUF1819 family protein [Ectothiorhodospira sp. 9100]MCG5518082.1 DUF1819 family protein [Ectothiorhodospira sp. 9905]
MTEGRYRISFTSGSLYHRESVKLAELYLSLRDWEEVRAQALRDNLLQARTESTAKRTCREALARLQRLNDRELAFLPEANHQDQAHLLWVAVCRLYQLIADFAVEVIHERFIMMNLDLSFEDFDAFYNRKSEWHDELDNASASTRNKLRQVLFRMLREAGLLGKDKTINAVLLSPRLVELLSQHQPDECLYFPVHESDIKGMST